MRPSRTGRAVGRGGSFLAAAVVGASVLLALTATASGAPFVPSTLHDAAAAHPGQLFRVIVQGQPATPENRVHQDVEQEVDATPARNDHIAKSFASINGLAAELTGRQILRLERRSDVLAITPDARSLGRLRPAGRRRSAGDLRHGASGRVAHHDGRHVVGRAGSVVRVPVAAVRPHVR